MPRQLRDEIAHFFSVYKDLERKKVRVDGWYSREDAIKEIEAARVRLQEQRGEGGGSHDALEGSQPVEPLGDRSQD
jgi:hypothetical protein